MLGWAVLFFIVAFVAGVLGFGGVAAGASDIARVLFFISVAIFVVSLVWVLVAARQHA